MTGVWNDKQDPHPHNCPCPECEDQRDWFNRLIINVRLRDEPLARDIAYLILDSGMHGSLEDVIEEARRMSGY